MEKNKKSTLFAYFGIIAVVLIWGLIPSAKKALIGNSFSASVYSAISTFSAASILLIMSFKNLKHLNRSYFKVAVPTGLCVCIATLAQALAYNFGTCPTNQAFLENLSCVIVPVILFFILKKRPSVLSVIATMLCIISSMVLSGLLETGLNFRVADILNATAGIFYGINIALTGIYAKKYMASLYVMIQLFIQAIFSAILAFVFNFLYIGEKIVDPFIFTPNPLLILAIVCIGILANSVCWTVRTAAMKHVSANVVAIIMPLSAVITAVFSVLIGQDKPTCSLLIGALLGVIAGLLCALSDNIDNKKIKDK